MFAVGKTATFLLDNKIEGSKIMINCDSQAAIRAINSTVIKNSTTNLEATMALNTLGESNEMTLRWITAHCGYEGNELADQLAKRGSNNDRATRIKLPMGPYIKDVLKIWPLLDPPPPLVLRCPKSLTPPPPPPPGRPQF